MMKRERFKGAIFGVVLTLMLVSAVGVFASGQVSKNVKVIYSNIKLVVDGKPTEFGNDSAGNKIEPFIYNGTTYLPVRAVGDAIGKKVDWDGGTQTVYLGKKPGEISYMTEEIEPYDNYYVNIYKLNSSKKLNIAGKEYDTAYLARNISQGKLQFNLNSQYKNLNFDLGPSAKFDNNYPGKLDIFLDNKLYKSYEVTSNSPIETININLNGVNQIRFEFGAIHTGIGIGNPIIK